MAAIRIPASAHPLLTLCKGHSERPIFKTYADLVGFVAAYGFRLVHDENHVFRVKPQFLDSPNPIPLDVFENRAIYPNFLIMALAHEQGATIAEDDVLLISLVEKYADVGASALASSDPHEQQIQRLCDLLAKSSTDAAADLKI